MNRMFFAQNVTQIIPAGLGYGRLYNWYASSSVDFAPTDWRAPTDSEIDTLRTFLGGYDIAGGKVKEVGLSHWESPNTGASNSSGLTLVGNGLRNGSNGEYASLKYLGYMWCENQYSESEGYIYVAKNDSEELLKGGQTWLKTFGLAVRLIYTGGGNPTTLTDYDGNIYNTVVIGTQRWISSNWKCTKYNDGTPIPNITNNSEWAALTTGAMCAYNNDENNV